MPGKAPTIKPRDEKPTKAEKQALREWAKAHGIPPGQAIQLFKENDDNATRMDIALSAIAYCNALPKA